jgi:hypothetical protein
MKQHEKDEKLRLLARWYKRGVITLAEAIQKSKELGFTRKELAFQIERPST